MNLELSDIREYVFALFVADNPATHPPGTAIKVTREEFLGTAFFVSRNGIALSAGHCIPEPSTLPQGKSLIAAVWDGKQTQARQVKLATVIDAQDIAVLKIAHAPTKFLPVSFEKAHMGEDVAAIGVPLHSVSGVQFEYRCLKGHVTLVSKTLELSFPAPRGMSGSPVLKEGKVVGVVSWNARAESLEDQSEEKIEKFGPLTKVTRTVTMAVTNYGQAEPLHKIADFVMPQAEGLSLKDLLLKMNREE